MQHTDNFSTKVTLKVNRTIEKIMRIIGAVAILWILLLLVSAMIAP